MSVEPQVFTHESPQSPQQAAKSLQSSLSPVQSASNKSFEHADLSKFDSCINGKLVQCESLNTSADYSTNPASRSSCASPPSAEQRASCTTEEQNLVMIDQQEVLELMEAKKMLDIKKQRSHEIGQGNLEPTQPWSSWKESLARRVHITPFESNECNDQTMESKLLPRDLLSCEDENSPKNSISE